MSGPFSQVCVLFGAIVCGLAVGSGAFAAHALEAALADQHDGEVVHRKMATWDTAVRYQFWHGMALIALGLWSGRTGRFDATARGSAWCFIAGIVLFSGCLYAWVLSELRWLVHVVPVGGLAFLVGWCLMAWNAFRTYPGEP